MEKGNRGKLLVKKLFFALDCQEKIGILDKFKQTNLGHTLSCLFSHLSFSSRTSGLVD